MEYKNEHKIYDFMSQHYISYSNTYIIKLERTCCTMISIERKQRKKK